MDFHESFCTMQVTMGKVNYHGISIF